MAADRFVPPPLHELESEVMEEVWRRGEANVRDVLEALNGQGAKQRAYTTVMTIMRRLDGKGLLCRRRAGRTDIYRACLSREEYLRARAEAEVDAVVEQYGEAAFVHFARQMATLDADQRQKLTRLARRG
ncbi:MAG TPA: BlaI/MecI/CopY family transcriptional regulator [Solirubrobacteraceae bacterium]|nr:BlaI/MecI/CopY family transcriptional regulator [Solirubrobacteraceae bacterium]